MGRPKPLLPLGSRSVVERCLESLIAAGVEDVIAVIGPSGKAIAAVLNDSVTFVRNLAPESDMATSVRLGTRRVAPRASGVLVALADHPLVRPSTIRSLLETHARRPHRIIIPTFDGRRGHPVLFPEKILGEIFTLPTLKEVVRRNPERVLPVAVSDPGILLDMDTPEDYVRICKLWEKQEMVDGGPASLLRARPSSS